MGYILYGNRSYHMSKISYADMSQAWTHRLFHALSYSSSRISLSLVPSARQTSQFRHLMRPSLVALAAPGLRLRLLALPFGGARPLLFFDGGGLTNAKSTAIVWSKSLVLCAPSIAARASSRVGYSMSAYP
jgi:hypothetical protein